MNSEIDWGRAMEQRSSAYEKESKETHDSRSANRDVQNALFKDAYDRQTGRQPESRQTPADVPGGLPALSITGHAESRAEAGLESRTQKPADSNGEKSKWTVVVDLGLSIQDKGVKEGSDRQLAELKELAEKTRGTGVTMVVQKLTAGEHGDKGSVERYLIRNGEIKQLNSEKSEGFAQDLKGLLQLAGHEAPSDKIALVTQTHGLGAAGVLADNGPNSLDDLKGAIKDGLAGSGHSQLDVLDFDACIMGSQSVSDKFHDLAKHIVASEEVETGSGQAFDCQSLKTVVGDLLKSPDMTAGQLADDFVDAARRGANGAPGADSDNHGGTDTLAHFDSSKYERFKGDLDSFGRALSSVAGDEAARSKLQEIIRSTPSFPENSDVSGERDLKVFAEKVMQAARDGGLPDPEHAIERSARALLEAQKDMTSSFYGEGRGGRGYDHMGGLSVYLPFGGEDEQARKAIEAELSSSIISQGAERDAALQTARMRLADYAKLSPEAQAQLTGVQAAERSLEAARTDAEFQKAVAEFDSAVKALKGTRVESELVEKTTAQIKKSRKTDLEQHAPNEGAWKDFLKMLDEKIHP